MTVPGLFLNDKRFANLRALIEAFEVLVSPPLATSSPPDNPAESLSLATLSETRVRVRNELEISEGRNKKETPRAQTRYESKGETGPGYLEGEAALGQVRSILAAPGDCAIDFEGYPTDPKWHGKQASDRTPRGAKGAAKEAAELTARMNGRARQRIACTLQLHHANGREVFVRLTKPERELPAMFAKHQATLVAHYAQYETELLLKYGVRTDVECTWMAARALYLTAMRDDRPQPMGYSLADLCERFLGHARDKTIRDRDWRDPAALDPEAIEYGLQDVRDCLALWRDHFKPDLLKLELWDGYREMQQALRPTAEVNINGGLKLDNAAHRELVKAMKARAVEVERELDRHASGMIANHASQLQISEWIFEEVLEIPFTPPKDPKLVSLLPFLKAQGGLAPDPGGELKARNMPRGLVQLTGLSLERATVAAHENGYIGLEHSTMDPDAGRPEEDDLLAAIDQELAGDPVYRLQDQAARRTYDEAKEYFDRMHKDVPFRQSELTLKLLEKTGGQLKSWRATSKGQLSLRKGSKARKAVQLAEAYPSISRYLIAHEQWSKATKLLEGFGETLVRWQDPADTMVRGQLKAYAAVTGRHSCVDPNLQNQPHDKTFRALWVARRGRKLLIADYSQIELRLLAIVADDEVLREVYREGRDVHQETADIAGIERPDAKSVNFALGYGSGVAGLCENFGFEPA